MYLDFNHAPIDSYNQEMLDIDNKNQQEEKKMKEIERLIISVFNDYAEDYDLNGVLEELFPDYSVGELVYEMYEAGMIPEDVIERFLEDE